MRARKIKAPISAAVTVLLIVLTAFSPFRLLDYDLQDRFYQEPGLIDPNIAVIGIDQNAVDMFGPYQQWSRSIIAEAIEILNGGEAGKPAVIAVDILYTEEGADVSADENLTRAVKDGGNVVLASYAEMGFNRGENSLETVITNHQIPFPALEPYVSYGLVNAIMERDGVIRSALTGAEYNGQTIDSFPSAIVKRYLDGQQNENINISNETYIHFTGRPSDYFTLSFADIFDEDFDPSFFTGGIVMIGAWAAGMGDSYTTPVSSRDDIGEQMYGVEINANVVQMLLEGNLKSRAPDWVSLVTLLIVMTVAYLCGERLDLRITLGVFAAVAAVYFFAARWVYAQGTVLPLLYVPAALVIMYTYQLTYGYILHAVEKAAIRNTFKKYVDPKLVDNLIESGGADSDEIGKRKHIAVLFVDVRGFTPISETFKDSPEQVVQILNEYLELTSTAVFNNGGSVDKFIGDATMALFNGFIPLDDYVYKAVKSAWDMVQGASKLNVTLKEKYGVDIGFGVGINCGEAIVGNLGPSFRKDYTAIGDTVNTAARLESKAERSQILISREVYEALSGRIVAVSIGEVSLKGKSVPAEVFSVESIT